MSLFAGLANEIIIRIMELTSAGDIVSLASCCKHFSALAQDRLAFHRKERAIAPDIVIGWLPHYYHQPLVIHTQNDVAGRGQERPSLIHPSIYLQAILENDDCRFYTKVMRTGNLECIEKPDEFKEEGSRDEEEECLVQAYLFVDHIKAKYGHKVTALVANAYTALLQYLGKYDLREWTDMIKKGEPTAVTFLLLTLYPNLEILEIFEPDETWSNEKDWGGLLISLISIAKRPDIDKLRPFSRFSELILQGDNDEGLEAWARLAVAFMELPSMRKIFGRIVEGRDVQWTAGVGTSEVIHLDLGDEIDRASLSSLIRGCKGLEVFSFQLCTDPRWGRTININELDSLEFGPQAEHEAACEDTDSDEQETERPCPENTTEDYRPSWEPRGIVADLLLCASHSLVSLDLTADSLDGIGVLSKDEPFIDSLRSFRVLKSVRLDTMMLFKKPKCSSNALEVLKKPRQHTLWKNMRPHRLVDFLPVTIEDFGITYSLVGQGLLREDVAEMFSGLPNARDRLPRLVVIRAERKVNWQSEEEKDGWQELRVRCRDNAINFVMRECD